MVNFRAWYDWGFPESYYEEHGGIGIEAMIQKGQLPSQVFLLQGLYVGIALSVLRLALNRFVLERLATFLLELPERRPPPPILRIDTCLQYRKGIVVRPTTEEVEAWTAQTGYKRKFVLDYIRQRRLDAVLAKKMNKFTEAAWRFLLYSFAVGFGVWVLHDAEWLWDPFTLCWTEYPQPIPDKCAWYYFLGTGIYIHLSIFQFFETKNSDFWEMFAHHVITLGLLTFSWVMNFYRIGTLIMLVHDVSDPLMDFAKTVNYIKENEARHHKLAAIVADSTFGVFAVTFVVTRLYVYPYYCVWNSITAGVVGKLDPDVPARKRFCIFLVMLNLLHVFWSYLILRMCYLFIFHGVDKDIRESDDEEVEGEEEREREDDTNDASSSSSSSSSTSKRHSGSSSSATAAAAQASNGGKVKKRK